MGKERGALVEKILAAVSKRDKDHQARWDRLWGDKLADQYRDHGYADFWVWDRTFYDAPVADLRHIATLVGDGPWRCRA